MQQIKNPGHFQSFQRSKNPFKSCQTSHQYTPHQKLCLQHLMHMRYDIYGRNKKTLDSDNQGAQKAVIKGETHKSKLAEHIWTANGDHIPLWNEIKIIDRERFWKEKIERSCPSL